MGSLTHCISIHELQKPIAEKIRTKQKEYLTDGYDGAQATQKAVTDIIGISKSQRSDIIEQVNKQLESDHPEILPKEEHPGVDRIRKDLKEDVQQVDNQDETAKVLQKLAKKFKKKIVFFKGSKTINGTFDPTHPDTLFINTATDKVMLFVFGHELLHNLKQDDHTLYVDLFKVLFNHVNNFDTFFEEENAKRKKKDLKVLTPVQMAEEFFADFTGEQFTDEKFWQKLIEKDKTLFDKVADLFGKLFRQIGDTSGNYFRDINTAQDALATVMKRYTDGQKAEAKKAKLKEAKAQAVKLKKSQADKKEKLKKEKAVSLFVKALKMIKGRMPEAHDVLVYQQEQGADIKAMIKAAPTMNIESLSDQADKTYDAVMAIDVINHVDPGERDNTIKDIIGRIGDNGSAIIATREWPGFDGKDLVAKVSRVAGKQYSVEQIKGFGDVAVLVKKEALPTEEVQSTAKVKYSTKDLDEKYTAAVEKDDMETAQKMVDAAAEKAGYNVKAYHGGEDNGFTIFDTERLGETTGARTAGLGFFFSPDKSIAQSFAGFRTGREARGFYLKMGKSPIKFDSEFATKGMSWEKGSGTTTNINDPRIITEGRLDLPKMKKDAFDIFWEWAELVIEKKKKDITKSDLKQWINDVSNRTGQKSLVFGNTAMDMQGSYQDQLVVFNPNQIKSADPVTYDDSGKVVPLSKRFKEDSDDIRYSTKDFDEVVKEVFQSPEDAENTIGHRVINAFKLVTDSDRREDLRQHLDNVRTFMVDRYAPIDRQLGKTIYKLHRMLNNSAATFGTFLQDGNLSWKDDALTVTTKDEGFVPWMKSLGEDGHKFLYWVAAKRAEKLSAEDRENWFTEDKRKIILDEVESRKMTEQYEKWNKKLQAYNSNIIDIAQEAGLIGKDARERWMSHYYLPFYRVLENEDTVAEFANGPTSSKKYISSGIKTLKGGEAAIGDPMHNLIRNWSHLIAESQRQMARASASEFMIDLGMAEEMTAGQLKKVLGVSSTYGIKGLTDDGKINWKDFKDMTRTGVMEVVDTTPGTSLIEKQVINSVPDVRKAAYVMSFMRDGKPVYVKVEDPALYEALTQVNMKSVNNSLVGGLGFFKRLLTMGATFGPAFRVANFLRDTLHTAVVSRSFLPFVDSAKGLVQVWQRSPDYIALMASGGGFSQGYLNSADPKALSRTIDKIIKNEGKSSTNFILDIPRKLLDFWEEVGHASEMAARVQLYTNLTTKKGDIPGESHLTGAFEAKDLLDFGLTGNSEIVRILTATIPFLNARMQGLDRMGRGAAADPRGFLTKGAIVAAASLALWAAYRDDDRYKELENWDKWQYHHFWIGDKHCRIPKAFEVGAVFSTFFEAAAETMTDEEGFGYFCDMLKHTFLNTFAIGYPTAFSPMAEVYANKSFFTGRDIEPEWMQGLKPGARFNPWESETLKVVGKNLNISPTKLHTLIRGYTATIGMGLLATADVMMEFREDVKTPEKYFHEYAGLDRFVKTKPGSTKYATRYYEFANAATETFNTINNYQRTGSMDLARQMAKDNPSYKARKDYINLVNKYLSTIRAEEKATWGNLSISREAKRTKLESLRRKKNEIYKRAYTFTKKKFKK